ncbi:hypothetical protein LXL04_020670 [Taraxacum kok-saghyz]
MPKVQTSSQIAENTKEITETKAQTQTKVKVNVKLLGGKGDSGSSEGWDLKAEPERLESTFGKVNREYTEEERQNLGYPRDAPATVLFGEWFRFGKPSDKKFLFEKTLFTSNPKFLAQKAERQQNLQTPRRKTSNRKIRKRQDEIAILVFLKKTKMPFGPNSPNQAIGKDGREDPDLRRRLRDVLETQIVKIMEASLRIRLWRRC